MNVHTNLDLTKLPGLNREKTRITPRLSETSGAQQRKNVNYRAFRNVGYNKRPRCPLRKDVPFAVDVRGFETTIRNEPRYS